MTVNVTTAKLGRSLVYGNMASGRRGLSRVRNNVAGYLIYVGAGSPPDLTGSYTYATTLPASVALTPPGSGTQTYYVVVLKRNQFGLVSKNQYASYSVTIDSTGAVVESPVPVPVGVYVKPGPGGQVTFRARYPTWKTGANPADTWQVFVKATPPNVNTDTPTGVMTVVGAGTPPFSVGTFAPSTWYWAICLKRTSDGAKSPAVTGSVVVPSVPPSPVGVA